VGSGEVFVQVVVGVEHVCLEQPFGHRLVLGKTGSAPPIVKELKGGTCTHTESQQQTNEKKRRSKTGQAVKKDPPKQLKHFRHVKQH